MKNEKNINNLSSGEVKKKPAGSKTLDELKQGLAEAGVKPLADDLLEDVAGGGVFYKSIPKERWASTSPSDTSDPSDYPLSVVEIVK